MAAAASRCGTLARAVARPHSPSVDSLVLGLAAAARESKTSTSLLLRDAFRRTDLQPHEQKSVKEQVYRLLFEERLVDHAFAVATSADAPRRAAGLPERLLASRVLAGEVSAAQAAERASGVDWARVAAIRDEVRALPDPVERTAILGGLPAWLARRMVDEFGDEAMTLAAALANHAPVVVRANTLRGTRDELRDRLLAEGIETAPTRFAQHALAVSTPARLFRSPTFHAGWFEMQDEASQLVAEVTAPPPRGLVVDVCAGAGGKTLALAAALGNRGTVWSLDVDRTRLADLSVRARRAGAFNVRTALVAPDRFSSEVEALLRRATRVLIDAPCSGVGTLRRHPELRRRLDEPSLERLRAVQRDLVLRAAELLAPGARLVYATCSVLREENEEVIAAVRAAHPDLEPVRVVEILGGARGRPITDPSGTTLQMAPHRHDTDGFFAAVLRRRG